MTQLRILFILVIIIFVLVFGSVFAAYAQGTSPWAIAQTIPLYTDAYPPILVADQNRIVHAFNSEVQYDGQLSIFYRQWNVDKGWSVPVDILLIYPSASEALQDVKLDPTGIFHIVFYKGDQERGDIMYSRAAAPDAGKSQAWSEPIEVGTASTTIFSAALAQFGDNHLTLVYSGNANGVGLYETHSDDGGDTWTKPIGISPVYPDGIWPYHIQIMFDEEGALHVVWGVVGVSGIGQKVYYTSRGADSITWRNPFLLAAIEGDDYGADWPSIIFYQDTLIAMYMDGTIPNGVPPTRWMRLSKDGGETWSLPVQPFPLVGENGRAVLLIDSANNLHIILSNRTADPSPIGGIWHGVWNGDQWGELDLVTPRSATAAVNSGSYATVPGASRPNAVIVQGNVLLSAWWHDIPGGLILPPAGYSYTRINSPELPIVPLPEATLTPKSTADPMIMQAVTPTSSLLPRSTLEADFGGTQPPSISASGVIFIGVIPVLIMTAVLVVHRLRRRSNRS